MVSMVVCRQTQQLWAKCFHNINFPEGASYKARMHHETTGKFIWMFNWIRHWNRSGTATPVSFPPTASRCRTIAKGSIQRHDYLIAIHPFQFFIQEKTRIGHGPAPVFLQHIFSVLSAQKTFVLHKLRDFSGWEASAGMTVNAKFAFHGFAFWAPNGVRAFAATRWPIIPHAVLKLQRFLFSAIDGQINSLMMPRSGTGQKSYGIGHLRLCVQRFGWYQGW